MFINKDVLETTDLDDFADATGGGSTSGFSRPHTSMGYGRHGSVSAGADLFDKPSTAGPIGSAGALPSTANQRAKMLAQQRELQKRKQQERMGSGFLFFFT